MPVLREWPLPLFIKMTKKVFGLTGGIGSGKSTLAKILQKKYSNIVVFDCDEQAKKIAKLSEIKNKLKKLLGNNDRKIIFENSKKKKEIERLIHPKVWEKLDKLVKNLQENKIVLVETAILFETGKNKNMVRNIATVCGLVERKKRIKKRNNWSEKEIGLRIKNQSKQDLIQKKADVVIDTECSLKELEEKTEKLYKYLIKPTKRKLVL
jgi:dephospho-CoA kinase